MSWLVLGMRYNHEMMSFQRFHAVGPGEGWVGHCRVLLLLSVWLVMWCGFSQMSCAGKIWVPLWSEISKRIVIWRYRHTLCNWIVWALCKLSPSMSSIMCRSCRRQLGITHGLDTIILPCILCKNWHVVSSHSAWLHGNVHVSWSTGFFSSDMSW